jgi:hypothetical protein
MIIDNNNVTNKYKDMNLDFRKLGLFDQKKAIENLVRIEDGSPNYIAYLFANEVYDLYSWYNLASTTEGYQYWYNLKLQIDEKV